MKNQRIIRISVLPALLLTLLLTSCEYHSGQHVVGSGDVEILEVDVDAFDGVYVNGTCNVDIETGDVQEVIFSAQPEILEVMTTTVSNGTLHIGFRPGYTVKTSEDIRASIIIPEVEFIGVSGAGNFRLNGAAQDQLDIRISGTCDVEAFDMEVERCSISVEGTSSCRVNVTEHLDVHISGVGYVVYRGNPDVEQDISGVGSVRSAS